MMSPSVATEKMAMRKSLAGLAILVVLAFGTLGLVHPSRLSAAQQAKESLGVVLFSGESLDVAPDRIKVLAAAARNARPSRGDCPRGTITAYAPKGDPLFQQALAAARRDAVRDALAKMGVDISQFYFQWKVADGEKITRDTELSFGAPTDETAPTVSIASKPTSGTRVKAGQQIAVTVTARDDTTRWESGILGIRLIADSERGRLVQERAYPPHLPTCEGQPEPATLSTVYTVPSPAPPIVRLCAIARDHANHEAKDPAIAEFPTGDWAGTMTWTHIVASAHATATTTAQADLSLDYDGKGGLTGRMAGTHSSTSKMGPCSGSTMMPGGMQANLVGSYTPGRDAMTIRTDDKQTTPMHMRIDCPGAKPVVSAHATAYEHYDRALTGLRPTADGGFESSHDQQYPCESGSTCTTRISLKLRPAK
jgi:hypothetical protein